MRFHLCGQWQDACNDPELIDLVHRAHQHTAECDQHLTVLFGYNGVAEILAAANKAARDANGSDISEEDIRRHLWTSHLPPIDLVIRTGTQSDTHNSDLFLPWQISNAQLYFSELCWPDFKEADLQAAFDNFAARHRKMGA